jgi:hypothetical protein
MKLNTIARTITAVILSLGALAVLGGTASAADPNSPFRPPYVCS